MSERLFPAVSALSLPGAFLVGIIRILCRLLGLFKAKQYRFPLPGFEENPRNYKTKDLLYFAYKYYLRPPEEMEKGETGDYFHRQQLDFGISPSEQLIETVRIHAGGDLMPYSRLSAKSCKNLWNEAGTWFFDADIVFANLETPVDTGRKAGMVPEVMLGNMLFNGSEELMDIFSGPGRYDVVSTANNHSLDMGAEGVKATLDFLQKRNIAATGTSSVPEEQWSFPIIERKGVRIAFISATYSLNHLSLPEGSEWMVNTGDFNKEGCNLSLIRKLVEKARERAADFTVLSLHTGNAYQAYPSRHTSEIFHRIFSECGPDLILGGHPHNPQPMEKINFRCPFSGKRKEGLAIYSLGDFVAYDIFTWCHLHLCIELEISKLKKDNEITTRLTGFSVWPQYLWAEKRKKEWELRFIPLEKTKEYEAFMSKRSRKELSEIHRFWQKHLAPSLREKLRVPF
jgi:hypothetical protein